MDNINVKTYTNIWLNWFKIEIEADSNRALPIIEIVWLPDTAINEAKERIRFALRNSWVELPPRKIILNLSPSDIKKIWTRFDLPMAVAILVLVNKWKIYDYELIHRSIFFWELWLDGSVKRVDWLLCSVISAIKDWYNDFFIPNENLYEIKYIEGIRIYPIDNILQIINHFLFDKKINCIFDVEKIALNGNSYEIDFNHIKWHYIPKRALMIAASWLHNILLVWSPWCWKTMLSKSLISILPPMNFDEIVQVSQIYSLVWKLWKGCPLIVNRPFRSVHHTASKVSIIWWWKLLKPWEISLSHKWVLFLDELAEFPRDVLEALRQPMEDREITISRASGTVNFPAHFMLVGAMNPCKCGFFNDKKIFCKCSESSVKSYQNKISWPLLDRFDIVLEVPRISIDKILWEQDGLSSNKIQDMVRIAWERQVHRFKDDIISLNSEMWSKEIDKYLLLDEKTYNFLKKSIKLFNLSPRLIHKIMKLSRTIADLENENNILIKHIAEWLQYRSKNCFIKETSSY